MPKKTLDFTSLTSCFETGTLDSAQLITEAQLARIGTFKTLKKGGYKLNGGIGNFPTVPSNPSFEKES